MPSLPKRSNRSNLAFVLTPIAAAALAAPATAQCGGMWTRTPSRAGPDYPYRNWGMAYDVANSRLVSFGGDDPTELMGVSNETWVWGGLGWSVVVPLSARPGARELYGIVYDAPHARSVMFGGQTDNAGGTIYYGDTWAFDAAATTWTQLATTGPAARSAHAMAYDAIHDRVVLFGGEMSSPLVRFGDTWTYGPAGWTDVSPGVAPSARASAAMAFDSDRGVCILFGGGTSSALNDTWEWDGSAWTQKFPAASPPVMGGHSMTYDPVRHRVVLFKSLSGPARHTWEYDGVTWTQVTPTSGPSLPTADGPLAFDTVHSTVLLRGPMYAGTWSWNGQAWTLLALTPEASSAAIFPAVFDPITGKVLHGSSGWFGWTGATWTRVGNAYHAFNGAALAFDPLRNEIVSFGGLTGAPSTLLDETWVWNGSVWTQRAVPGPAPDQFGAMGFDQNSGLIFYVRHDTAQTWTWNGAAWTLTAAPPLSVGYPSLAFDAARQKLVLAGFTSNTIVTYEWNGASWTQIPLASPPSVLGAPTLVYNPDCGHILMFCGLGTSEINWRVMVWSWDGAAWSLYGSIPPAGRTRISVAYDPIRHACVLHGGRTSPIGQATVNDVDTWEYSTVSPCPSDTNGDRIVNFADLNSLLSQFGQFNTPGLLSGDLNNDGFVNFADLNLVLSSFGVAC